MAFTIDQYPDLFVAFMDAKEARNAALRTARNKLDKAQTEYAAAVAAAPEVAAWQTARDNLQAFRRWAYGEGYGLTDPRSAVPGVTGTTVAPTKEG